MEIFNENKQKVNTWLNNVKIFSLREAKETKIASKIFRKVIRINLGLEKGEVSKDEIEYLKKHSKDLIKIMGFVATAATPIPYMFISIALKKAGIINLFPSNEDLNLPNNHDNNI